MCVRRVVLIVVVCCVVLVAVAFLMVVVRVSMFGVCVFRLLVVVCRASCVACLLLFDVW